MVERRAANRRRLALASNRKRFTARDAEDVAGLSGSIQNHNKDEAMPEAIKTNAGNFAPWKAPFKYNSAGQWIEDTNGERMLDMRGWGFLTGKGSAALGLDETEAARLQDEAGRKVAELMNADSAKQ